ARMVRIERRARRTCPARQSIVRIPLPRAARATGRVRRAGLGTRKYADAPHHEQHAHRSRRTRDPDAVRTTATGGATATTTATATATTAIDPRQAVRAGLVHVAAVRRIGA